MNFLKYIPTAFDKKHTHTVEMPNLNLVVSRLRPEIVITRTKDDPGAIHMAIQTKGGTAAILRYAYAEPAMKRKVTEGQSLYRIKTKYNTANLIIGSFSGSLEDEDSNKLLELLLAVIQTNENIPNWYDKDGFIRLIRKHHYSHHGTAYGDDPSKVSYGPEIDIQCYGIRDENDEVVVALVNAICMWGNKVNVQYYSYGPHRYYANDRVNTMFLRNHDIIDAMDEMTVGGLSDDSINMFIPKVASMFELIDDMPEYVPNRKRRRTNSPPIDGYYYREDEFFY